MQKRTSKKRGIIKNAKRVLDEGFIRAGIPAAIASDEVVAKVMAQMGAKGRKTVGKRRLGTVTEAQRSKVAKSRSAKAPSKQ